MEISIISKYRYNINTRIYRNECSTCDVLIIDDFLLDEIGEKEAVNLFKIL